MQDPGFISPTLLTGSDPPKLACGLSPSYNSDGSVADFSVEWCDEENGVATNANGCPSGAFINGIGIQTSTDEDESTFQTYKAY